MKIALMFKSAGVGTFIKCVAMKQNIDSLESLYELGKRFGVYVTVSSRVISDHESKKAEDYSFGSVDLYRKFFKMNSRYISVDKTAKKFSREEMLNRAACGAGINAMSIDPFGGVHACNTFHKPAGNLRQESLNDIWKHMGSLNLPNRRMHNVTLKCTDCEYLEYCTVCVADLLNKNRGNVISDCGENILQAQAADVPNFRQVAEDYVSGGERTHHDKKMFCYSYECSIDLRQNFTEQYINLLRQKGIRLVDHEENDWRATSANYLDIWYFTYKGENIEFWQYKYFGEGRISFIVRVADALTYEER